jgi:hypothetical protein
MGDASSEQEARLKAWLQQQLAAERNLLQQQLARQLAAERNLLQQQIATERSTFQQQITAERNARAQQMDELGTWLNRLNDGQRAVVSRIEVGGKVGPLTAAALAELVTLWSHPPLCTRPASRSESEIRPTYFCAP